MSKGSGKSESMASASCYLEQSLTAMESEADAGRSGYNDCRVCESILATGMPQNLSRGSDTLAALCHDKLYDSVGNS